LYVVTTTDPCGPTPDKQLDDAGKTFIYDKRRPELTKAVLTARNAAHANASLRAEQRVDDETTSWRERALNAEALAKSLRATITERDARISDLTGQLYDPDGNYLAERNAELRELNRTLNQNLSKAETDIATLQRSLDAARANVKRERERNVTQLFADA
jgi:chromosome segregation ATPase